MIKKKYFNKIQSDYIFSYILSFFNLLDIRSIYPLSKRFLTILNKDNKKIIRDIQNKIYNTEKNFTLNLNNSYNYKITSFPFNKSPIINSIIAQNFLISSSYQFNNGFFIYDLNKNILCQKIFFDEKKNYSYINSILYIKEKKIILLGSNNGYIIGYYLNNNKNNVSFFWEYKTGLNKEIKNMTYFKNNNYSILISLDANDDINLNFLRIFYIKNEININNKEEILYDENTIKYIKSYVIKNVYIYNIKYFSEENNKNNNKGFICLALNKGNNYFNNDNNITNKNNIFKKDIIINNELGIINITQIKYNLENIENNYEIIINKGTYEELNFDINLKGHKSYITDYIYITNINKINNYILSIEYLSPYLFIWDIELKSNINIILLPHTDSILSLLNIENKYIGSSGRDRKIYLYNIKEIFESNNNNKNIIINYKEIKSGHKSDIYKLNFYSNEINNSIISSSFDKTIKLFLFQKNNYNFNEIKKIILTGHSSPIICIKYDTLRKQIITIDIESVINIWEYNKVYGFFNIIKSIEINNIKGKKEFFDDIILLYDNLNSLIKIDRTNTIKIFSLLKEEFLYEFCDDKNNKNEFLLKILDFCNFRDFLCYTSKNVIKLYNYKIKNNFYEINYIKTINICDEKIIEEKAKMTCFDMLSWKYKIIGIGYNNKKIIIIKFDDKNMNNKQYIIDMNHYINDNDNNINRDIIQIKSIEYSNKKINDIEYILYMIFSINNIFYIFSLVSNYIELKIDFISKIVFKNDVNTFEILNKNLIICSFLNNFKNGLIYLPDYSQDKNKDINIDIIELSQEIFNKIIFANNKKGIFFISNDSIKYIEFN